MIVSSLLLWTLALFQQSPTVFSFAPNYSFLPKTKPSFHLHSQTSPFDEGDNRFSEFTSLEPLPESEIRRKRLKEDRLKRAKFAQFGDELWDLRRFTKHIKGDLHEAIKDGFTTRSEQAIRETLRNAQMRDPEIVYRMELEACHQAELEGRMNDARRHGVAALEARSCLPQFNLEGLWVGKYGNHGYEMINVTYVGDLMIAYKVTGDKNVPRGEITFQADLSPMPKRQVGNSGEDQAEELQPIILTDTAARKWGTKQLPRHAGLGQVAEEGFVNSQWMDGQLILIGDDYFSFAWVPIEHQIFFGRPSPELTLKMLRDGGESTFRVAGNPPPVAENDVGAMKEYARRCLEMTSETIEEEMMEGKMDPFSCIWHGERTEECYFE